MPHEKDHEIFFENKYTYFSEKIKNEKFCLTLIDSSNPAQKFKTVVNKIFTLSVHTYIYI